MTVNAVIQTIGLPKLYGNFRPLTMSPFSQRRELISKPLWWTQIEFVEQFEFFTLWSRQGYRRSSSFFRHDRHSCWPLNEFLFNDKLTQNPGWLGNW